MAMEIEYRIISTVIFSTQKERDYFISELETYIQKNSIGATAAHITADQYYVNIPPLDLAVTKTVK